MIYFKLTAVNLRNIVEIMRKSTAELSLHFSHFVGNAPNPIYLQTTQIFTSLSQKTFSGDCSVSKQILSHLPRLAPKDPQTVRQCPLKARIQGQSRPLKAWIRIWASVNTKRCSSYPLRIESESLWTLNGAQNVHSRLKSLLIVSRYGRWKVLTCPLKARTWIWASVGTEEQISIVIRFWRLKLPTHRSNPRFCKLALKQQFSSAQDSNTSLRRRSLESEPLPETLKNGHLLWRPNHLPF